MCRAVRVVRSGEMGYLRASKYSSGPTETLETYEKETSLSLEKLVNTIAGRNVLLSELVNELLEYCITMDQRYYELKCQDIKRMALQLAIINGLQRPFST
jgi:hypothetical protein